MLVIWLKKTDYDTKVTEIENKLNNHNHDKYITTTEFNTLAADVFNARLSQENLVTKTDFDNTVSSLDSKMAENKTKNKSTENELKKLKTFDSSYSIGKNYFDEDSAQNYLIFQSIHRYCKVTNTKYISSRKSKGLSEETITPYATSDNSLTLVIDHYGSKVRVKFNKGCLKQPDKITYDYGHRVNVYIVYELNASSSNDSDPTLKSCLYGTVTLTKNVDLEKYGYSGCGTGFDRRASFSFPGGGFGQNVLIFGVDVSTPAHIDNKKNDILVLGKGPTQGLEHTPTPEKMYSINFSITNKNLSVDNMKRTGFTGYVYDFSVDYDPIAAGDIKDIHKYLMEKII